MSASWRRDRPSYLRLVPPEAASPETAQPDQMLRELLFLIELERRPDLAELADHLLDPELDR